MGSGEPADLCQSPCEEQAASAAIAIAAAVDLSGLESPRLKKLGKVMILRVS